MLRIYEIGMGVYGFPEHHLGLLTPQPVTENALSEVFLDVRLDHRGYRIDQCLKHYYYVDI